MAKRSGIIFLAAAFILSGCGKLIDSPEAGPDLLFVRSGGDITLIHSATGTRKPVGLTAVPSRSWSTMVSARPASQGTRGTQVEATDPLNGTSLWTSPAPGRLSVRLVAEDGSRAVLGPEGERHFSRGRTKTRFVVVGDGIAPQTINLQGNIEPEAFSTDGEGIFVLRYTPARRPLSYQVLRLDLATGEMGEVYTPDAELQEQMQGTARTQAVSPDGRFLYTLYTIDDRDGHSHAFVHVLNLDDEWAHCIDLPEGFGYSRDQDVALAVTPDGDRLYLADAGAAKAAVIDTRLLSVTQTPAISVTGKGKLHALSGRGGDLYLAKGRKVVALEPDSLRVRFGWDLLSNVRGIQLSSNGTKLYVGVRDSIDVLDLTTGDLLETLNPIGIDQIDDFGPVMPTPFEEEDYEKFTCAC